MKITIKENAVKMLNNKLEHDQFLRVTVIEGGCAGLTYSAEIAKEMQDGEKVVLQSGSIRVVSNESSNKYLDGLIIDYSDDLISSGLQFTNANTKTTCGCGKSFSLAGFPAMTDGNCSNK